MTLIELLVAVSVLAVMVLAFSTILVQAQRFISLARATRRSHQLAANIARIVRNDLRQATLNGFIAITTDGDEHAMLVFTTAGVSYSLTDHTVNVTGTGSLVCYGMTGNAAASSDPDNRVLWRPAYVLYHHTGDEADEIKGDWLNADLGSLQRKTKAQVHDLITKMVNLRSSAASILRVPPTNIGEINLLWQVLSAHCSDLSVMWTDGTTDYQNNLNWYGVDVTREGGLRVAPSLALVANMNDPNYKEIEDPNHNNAQAGQYRAVWTHRNQRAWPKAVKVRFKILDPYMPGIFRGRTGRGKLEYEIICNIGQ